MEPSDKAIGSYVRENPAPLVETVAYLARSSPDADVGIILDHLDPDVNEALSSLSRYR